MNRRTLTIQITDAPQTCGLEDVARLQCVDGVCGEYGDSGRILLEADFIEGGPPVENAVAAFVVRWINEMYFEVTKTSEIPKPSCWNIIDRFATAVRGMEEEGEVPGIVPSGHYEAYLKARDELANAML
jgi:hypothetical protein